MSDTITGANLELLEGLLQGRLRGCVRNVRVIQRDGQVLLQGTAINYYAKQMAQHLALHSLKTAVLVNEIDVRSTTPAAEQRDVEVG